MYASPSGTEVTASRVLGQQDGRELVVRFIWDIEVFLLPHAHAKLFFLYEC